MRRVALLLGCVALLPAAAPDGWQLYANEHYQEAIASWTAAGSQGDPNALFGLGLAYDLGRGVTQDESRACALYRQAGEAGIPAAAFNYAVMLDGGRCGVRDGALAADWYGRAAALGHPRAEYDLGQLYEHGDGVPRNIDQAVVWYRLASTGGLTAADTRAKALDALPRQRDLTAYAAPIPSSPVGATLPDRGLPVPFVWSAPAQPSSVSFFLEVRAIGMASPQEIATRYVDRSAAEIVLPPGAADYAWRVFAVSLDSREYAASGWQRFTIGKRDAR